MNQRSHSVRILSRPFRPSLTALGLVLLIGVGAGVSSGELSAAAATDVAIPPLLVTEITPDNVGYDNFEFFEVTNTTTVDIDVDDAGVGLNYIFADSDDRIKDVPFVVPTGTVIAAEGTTVFWLDYSTATVNTQAFTEADFRAHFASETDSVDAYPVVRVTGQSGMANGGNRGIRIIDGTGAAISWAFYPTGSVAVDASSHFGAPASSASLSQELVQSLGTPTPGNPAPKTAPTPTPTATATPTPTATSAPSNADTAPLQITEITPDSTNVGSADGFEFIEVYNATADPINFADYTLNYLYPLADLTNSSTVRWPSTPSDVVIAPGGTLVFWIKNGQNDTLTATEFNAAFGSSLTFGTDLVEVFAGGMANGSARGIEILTNTGFSVNTAYYNLNSVDDVDPNVGIQYGNDGSNPARQLNLAKVAANPGTVFAAQVASDLKIVADDSTPPAITDHTLGEIDPAQNFTLSATVTDDVQARTVEVHLKSNIDTEFVATNLSTDGADGYRHDLQRVDLTGKRWYEYYFTADDGSTESSTPVVRVDLTGVDNSPVRLNVTDGQFVAGSTTLSAAGDSSADGMTLSIDNQVVHTSPDLEFAPQFVFEVTAVNTFFQNGVLAGTDILHIFDDGIPTGWETIATPVPLTHVTQGEDLVVSVWAGSKVAPEINPNENNDDFQIRNPRLVLPDGRSLQPVGYSDPTLVLNMGDSAGKLDFYDASFTIPSDAFMAVAHSWDTAAVADGAHSVLASNGVDTLTRTVTVDNTAPVVTTSAVAGTLYQGEFMIEGGATDAGAGFDTLVATLDGRAIELPYATSSIQLADGEHTLVLTARDMVGNVGVLNTVFSTPVEEPGNELITPLDGAVVEEGPIDLSARATDPTGDQLDVTFRRGFVASAADSSVRGYSGTTAIANGTDRAEKTLLTDDQVTAMARLDGATAPVTSESEFPYQLFEVDVPADAGADFTARVRWDGTANADAKVLLYVQNLTTGAWEEFDRHVTIGEGATAFTLDAMVPALDHMQNQVMTVLIQHSEGFAGADLSDRSSTLPVNNVNDTARADYDFTLAVESDTQYYNDTFFQRQLDIHDYLLKQRTALNLQYLFHTGDIVDNFEAEHQWANANAAYSMLDDAELPYGVLAGNHDVGQKDADYAAYKANFGAERYDANPWYGGSFEDNRGHYDLITAGGIDFIMLYLGWAPSADGIAWLNEVLAQYPERTAILNLHEYMLTTGGLGAVPQQIYDEVVAPNANVAMVFSGHYHDAFTRIDQFDDNDDGTPDRSVYQMLFDYQGLPEGGQSFLRLLHFDNVAEQISVRTYSPYLDIYNSDDPTLDLEHQEFTVPYSAFGMTSMQKSLATDAFTVDILTNSEIAGFDAVTSGTTVTASWNPGVGTHGWFAYSADSYGANAYSEVRTLTVTAPVVVPEVTVPEVTVPEMTVPEVTAPRATPAPESAPAFTGSSSTKVVVPAMLTAASQALADTASVALAAEIAAELAAELAAVQTDASTTAPRAASGTDAPTDDRGVVGEVDVVDNVAPFNIWTIALILLGAVAAAVIALVAIRILRTRR
ncbi:lamin tail domain-containing protein [Cryobacterium sp. Y11]|uniref:lamin tail domain-containing protein n=1 Tax=Cryobacterium sp. Y11 TaxID=2045016 RepID=UPI0011B01A76|nr:lamin tail domain-containing protein [Cryobacterium sp. Y11]